MPTFTDDTWTVLNEVLGQSLRARTPAGEEPHAADARVAARLIEQGEVDLDVLDGLSEELPDDIRASIEDTTARLEELDAVRLGHKDARRLVTLTVLVTYVLVAATVGISVPTVAVVMAVMGALGVDAHKVAELVGDGFDRVAARDDLDRDGEGPAGEDVDEES